eukprot:2923588-Rhodomonas_salina.1
MPQYKPRGTTIPGVCVLALLSARATVLNARRQIAIVVPGCAGPGRSCGCTAGPGSMIHPRQYWRGVVIRPHRSTVKSPHQYQIGTAMPTTVLPRCGGSGTIAAREGPDLVLVRLEHAGSHDLEQHVRRQSLVHTYPISVPSRPDLSTGNDGAGTKYPRSVQASA